MKIIQMDLSEEADDDLVQFVKHVTEADLSAFDCSAKVTETELHGHPAVKFIAYFDETEMDESEKLSSELQHLADDFYGHHEYVCGVYSDTSKVTVSFSPFTIREDEA